MVPVIVVTGFLGSGKTTLLNALLDRRRLRGATGRVALVVNELGEVGIDGSLLPADAQRQVELPGGCVCCVLNDELDKSLIDLVEANPGLDAIVIETTGVAEPLPIVWTLEREPAAGVVRLAAVVTLIDAIEWIASREVSPSVEAQVEHADVLVLTKAEVAGEEAAERVRTEVRALAPDAPWVEGTTAEVAEWLDGLLEDPPLRDDAGRDDRARGHDDHDHDHGDHDHGDHDHDDHDHDHHDHDHAPDRAAPVRGRHGVDSVWVACEGLHDLEELIDALEELGPEYIRIKGIVYAVDLRTGSSEPHWVAFHRVGLRVSTEPVKGPLPARAVALGPGVDAAALRACLERAVLSSDRQGRGDS